MLEFEHIGIEAPFRVSVPLDVKEQIAILAWLNTLCFLDEFKKCHCRVVEVLVAVNHMIYRDGVITGCDF